jgi:leucyl-tRNA---protein transferase
MQLNEITESCEFFKDKRSNIRYFFTSKINEKDFDLLLEAGFRKFGYLFFRYDCTGCSSCRSLRVIVDEFLPSKSQRRVLKKNGGLRFLTRNLSYHKEHYDLYLKHNNFRFAKNTATEEEFIGNFCLTPVDSLITEIRDGERLVGIGYVDIGVKSLSSVYYFYDPDYARFSPGVFSSLMEIDLAKKLGKKYYYLGFCAAGVKFSDYKTHFKPNQIYLLEENRWIDNM